MTKKTNPPFPRAVRERAVRLVLEPQDDHPTHRADTRHAMAEWHFTTAYARVKLKRLYPTF